MRLGRNTGVFSQEVATRRENREGCGTARAPSLDDTRTAVKRMLLIALAMAACTSVLSPASAGAAEPTLHHALSAPAADLAQGYLWVEFATRSLIPAAKKGVNVHIDGETIDKKNVEEYERKYNTRLEIYGKAIKQRGYRTIAGHYRGEATRACAEAGSAWTSLIRADGANDVEITQNGFEARLIVTAKYKGARVRLNNAAVVVESSIVVQDRMNSEYFFRGRITGSGITIKPTLSVLRAWPKWAHPPSRKALETCTVTLKPLDR